MTEAKKMLGVLDPAWNTDDGGGNRGANAHYKTFSVAEMSLMYRCSEPWTDVGDALVFMWATRLAFLEGDAHALANSLHLRFCSDFVWCKTDPVPCNMCEGSGLTITSSSPLSVLDTIGPCSWCEATGETGFVPAAMLGLGWWSRSEHELLLVCRRGDVPVPPPAARPRSVIYAPRVRRLGAGDAANKTIHSAKPERAWRQVIEPIARACMPGVPGVEWNSRQRRRGWGAVGRLDGEDKPIRYVPCPSGETIGG